VPAADPDEEPVVAAGDAGADASEALLAPPPSLPEMSEVADEPPAVPATASDAAEGALPDASVLPAAVLEPPVPEAVTVAEPLVALVPDTDADVSPTLTAGAVSVSGARARFVSAAVAAVLSATVAVLAVAASRFAADVSAGAAVGPLSAVGSATSVVAVSAGLSAADAGDAGAVLVGSV
jgi:hypothetical protein